MSKSKIVNIPVKMERYFGKGTMLHPNIEAIEELIKTIPKGKIATIDTLCKKLADDFGTAVTCPMRTGNAIKKISEEYSKTHINENVPFWRVVRPNKMLIKSKESEFWASKIEDEGFTLQFTKSNEIKIDFDSDTLFQF